MKSTTAMLEQRRNGRRLGVWLMLVLHDHRIFGFPKRFDSDNPFGVSAFKANVNWDDVFGVSALAGLIAVRRPQEASHDSASQVFRRVCLKTGVSDFSASGFLYGRESHRLRVLQALNQHVKASHVLSSFRQDYRLKPQHAIQQIAQTLYNPDKNAHAVANDWGQVLPHHYNGDKITFYKKPEIGGCMPGVLPLHWV